MVRIRPIRPEIVFTRRIGPVAILTIIVEDENCYRDIHKTGTIESHLSWIKVLKSESIRATLGLHAHQK
jgi:hypothetical protein